jgi:hypothetical protein
MEALRNRWKELGVYLQENHPRVYGFLDGLPCPMWFVHLLHGRGEFKIGDQVVATRDLP